MGKYSGVIFTNLNNNKQIKKYINMEQKNFTNSETTREQYLSFKAFIKDEAKYKSHWDYVAYYIFKHRLVGEERDAYLEDEVRHRCYKGLYNGRIVNTGGEMTENYAIPAFKNLVIGQYNKFASLTGEND